MTTPVTSLEESSKSVTKNLVIRNLATTAFVRKKMTTNDTMLWHIHGNLYDLSKFLESHPGGRSILIASRGLPDATPLFESYHAFANRQYIRNELERYRVMGPGTRPLYSYDKVYEKIIVRARKHFGIQSDWETGVKKIKADKFWWAKIFFETLVFTALWLLCFVAPVSYTGYSRFITGILTGVVFISLGFNTMHDGSHFAIGPRNHWANEFFLKAWTAWALWSSPYWMTHHVVRHHAFTGSELDPDTHHAKPFIRKTLESSRDKFIMLPTFLKETWHYALLTASIFSILPGMYLGQVLSYSLIWPIKRYLWKMPHPEKGSFDRRNWELVLSLLSLMSHFYFSASF